MIIELCDEDLESYINRKGGILSELDSVAILQQVLLGFKELISHNFIHRDIKPANILVKGDVFKVADFGFSTKADIYGSAVLQDQCGSPMYESPQLLQGKSYTAKCDI